MTAIRPDISTDTSLPGPEPDEDPTGYYCIHCCARPGDGCRTATLYAYVTPGLRRPAFHDARRELRLRCAQDQQVQAAMFAIGWADRPALA
jgi:hypothetical protein